MIRLATVFSGIGAIEHALKRMRLEHKIVFACDNGDVDILSEKINPDLKEVGGELASLTELAGRIKVLSEEDSLYREELNRMLCRTKEEYEKLREDLARCQKEEDVRQMQGILERILGMPDVKAARSKEYRAFLDGLAASSGIDATFRCYQCILAVSNDFKKDNPLGSLGAPEAAYASADGIDWKAVDGELLAAYGVLEANRGKKLIRRMKDICERTGMLHEKINSFHILKELGEIEDYGEKKRYVDALYRGHESQNKVKQSYLANYELDEAHFHWNVSFLDGRQYRDQVDLFVGGSPCQSFSLVGKQRGLEDTRGTLFYEYARLVGEIRPKVFIYENVKALLSNDEGRTWETIQQVFTDLDYSWLPMVLNARDYGIPQNRERVFVVGFRNDLILERPFEPPKPVELKKTMQDFLLENVSGRYYLPRKGVDFVTSEKNLTKKYTQIDGEIQLCQKKNQQFNWHGDFVFEEENTDRERTMEELEKYFLSEKVRRYVLATGTKNFYSRPEIDLAVARPLLTTMHKMHRAGVDNYVTTDGRLRKLTPRECLRLMGFCDSFRIVVSDTSAYQQAGNSIVVDVLIHIMESVLSSYPKLGEEA